METKLALKLNKRIINLKPMLKRVAKAFRVRWNRFRNLTEERRNEKEELSPLIRELSGFLTLKPDFYLKKDYLAHLEERHKK